MTLCWTKLYFFMLPLTLVLLLQIYSSGQLHHFTNGFDVQRCNWMRFVNPMCSPAERNLLACQNRHDVFFYTIRTMEPGNDPLVWRGQEYTTRLCGHPEEQTDSLKQSE